jgi:hypothetical protein
MGSDNAYLEDLLFARRAITKEQVESMGVLKGLAYEYGKSLMKLVPPSDERREALRRLKESLSWACTGVAFDGTEMLSLEDTK